MKLIDKAFELHDQFGIDPDEIMLKTPEETEIMFPGEIEFEELIDTTDLEEKLEEVLKQIDETNKEIKNLVEVEIPEAEEYADSAKGYEAVDAHNDLQYAKQSLIRAQKKLKELTELRDAYAEQIRRANHPNMDVYDEPEEYQEEKDTRELDELNRKLYSLDQEIEATEECLKEKIDYMRKMELETDLRYAKNERDKVIIRIREIENKQKEGSSGAR